jgi:hypothetical protein
MMRFAWPPDTLLTVLSEGAVIYLVYAGSVWAFGVPRNVRASYRDYGRMLLSSLRPIPRAVAEGAS